MICLAAGQRTCEFWELCPAGRKGVCLGLPRFSSSGQTVITSRNITLVFDTLSSDPIKFHFKNSQAIIYYPTLCLLASGYKIQVANHFRQARKRPALKDHLCSLRQECPISTGRGICNVGMTQSPMFKPSTRTVLLLLVEQDEKPKIQLKLKLQLKLQLQTYVSWCVLSCNVSW